MSQSSPPPAPDYTPIANASAAASAEDHKLQQEMFDWGKSTYADNKATTDKVVNNFLDAENTASANAAKDRARYENVEIPEQDKLFADADSYASPQRKDLEIGRAQAGVTQAFDAARTNATRSLEAYGVDPSSTRFGALDIGARTQQAAASAGAGNQASQQVDATGRALRDEAINVGMGLPAQSTSETNTGLQAGTGAVNTGLATTASGSSTMGTPVQYGGLGNSALNVWGNTLHNGYSDALGAWNASQNASSGVGSALGFGASMLGSGGAFGASGAFGALGAFADGGAVAPTGAVPPPGATPGGAVPVSASPSGGQATDDVPSALTVGEFVIPKDTVTAKGTDFFHKLIAQTRENQAKIKAQSGALPVVRPSAIQRPAFVSRPGALPMQRAA